MKNLRKFILAGLASFSFALSGCEFQPNPPKPQEEECTNHYDSNSDGKCDYCGADMPTEKQEFTGLAFKNETFTYDGKEHSIFVKGVPEFATVTYDGNGKIEPNTYVVYATVKAEGYRTKKLSAKLIIKGLTFEGITFKDASFDYDGKTHSIEVEGLPDFATVTYTNNGKSAIGTYTVKATITADHYQTLDLKATLTIKGKQLTGITFEDQVILYDGNYHSIYAQGVPNFADVVYENNNQKYQDTYIVKATITAEGYVTLVLTAKMTITKKIFPDATFSDLCWIYDGKEVNLKAYFESYEEKLDYNRINYSVVYKVNGVASKTPTIKNVGKYNVSATYSASDFPTKTFSFNVAISDQIGVTDPNKTAFKFTNDLKFKDFYNEIKKGNFSIKKEILDEYDYDKDGIYEEVIKGNESSNYYVTEEAYAGRRNENSMKFETYDYYAVKGTDYAYLTSYEYGSLETTKFPVDCYLETVTDMCDGMLPFAALLESDDGGFRVVDAEKGEDYSLGGGVITYGFYEIDTVNNCFIVTLKTPYFHLEWNHNEVGVYYFYNVGNTKVNVPEAMKGVDEKANTYGYASFIKNGLEYSLNSNGKFSVDLRMDEFKFAYAGSGTYVLDAEIDGIQIGYLTWHIAKYNYRVNFESYTLCLYFDKDGVYQGKHASFDALSSSSINSLRNIKSRGATTLYYGEW
ncbi:MAG: MBG domain-containing protein [Bacilli bacterium]|nr:MBG domain-containing protein [Bacilli bacterium]